METSEITRSYISRSESTFAGVFASIVAVLHTTCFQTTLFSSRETVETTKNVSLSLPSTIFPCLSKHIPRVFALFV